MDVASEKIEFLKAAKKATVVHSSARYPGTSSGSYREMFTEKCDENDDHVTNHDTNEKLQEFTSKTLQTKLQFYSFKSKRNIDDKNNRGLGSVPDNLRSASNLTVYNTGQCPYNMEVVTEDPLEAGTRSTKMRQAKMVNNHEDVGDGGKDTALHGDHEAGGVEDRDMFYFPEMGDLPLFDLPDDLQLELPNIATDLQVKRS